MTRLKGLVFLLAVVFATLPACRSGRAPGAGPMAPTSAKPPSPPGTEMATLIAIDEPARAVEPPVELTASDGTGLRLQSFVARAVVVEPLAFTELQLAFENPEDRRLEGTFKIALPQGAAVARFAMKIDDRWQEGEVVELSHAREAYEDFLHKRQDPALLEQSAGGEFTARVFPIPPRGIKEIILSYSQEIDPRRSYVLPLRGLPELQRLSVEVSLGSSSKPALEVQQESITPEADVVLDPSLLKGGPGLVSGDLALVRVRPEVDARPDAIPSALVLFDTSASRALGFAEQTHMLERIVRELVARSGPGTPLTVACFDQTVEPVFDGEAGGFGRAEIARIWQRQALGASDLGRALAWAREKAHGSRAKRLILVTDGVATAGITEPDGLVAGVRALKASGVERMDAVRVGGLRDDAGLARLVTAGLARDGVVVDGELPAEQIVSRLSSATRSGIAVAIEGARWSWPRRLDGVQPGDERLVYAQIPAGGTVKLSVDGAAPVSLKLAPVERPLLERSWVQAKITDLLGVEQTKGEAAKEIVALSIGHRVLTPYTGMLVLETEYDYARFGIDRRAQLDVLTVDGGRVAMSKRGRRTSADPSAGAAANDPSAPVSPWARDESPARANGVAGPAGNADARTAVGNMWGSGMGDSFGAGGLGLSGAGEGGGGGGEGIGLGEATGTGHGAGVSSGQGIGYGHGRLGGGSHQVRAPAVRQGSVTVSGRLPPEVIQRIVRQNFGRFRQCYQEGLRIRRDLQGRVAVRFVIDRTGAVTNPVDGGSDLPDASVVSCVVNAFSDLSFPQPEGGIITVVYPITFSPEGAEPAAPPPPAHLDPQRVPINLPPPPPPPDRPQPSDPYEGKLKTVMQELDANGPAAGLAIAARWHQDDPGDVMALVGLGEALERGGSVLAAARAYGSILELFPARADMRRFAGERLDRLGDAGRDLAIDTYEKAEAERPDHPSSHRLLAFAWLRRHEYAKAFEAAERGMQQSYPSGRFASVYRVLSEDLGLIGAAWIKAEPARRAEITQRVQGARGTIEDRPSLRFVLNWETDSNDVDLHVFDAKGGHAFYAHRELESGGELYADVTTGYGPECFTIRRPTGERAGPYTLQASYFSRGPMGYGMGKVEIIDHDGQGGITIEERPFVVMVDRGFVDLGTTRL